MSLQWSLLLVRCRPNRRCLSVLVPFILDRLVDEVSVVERAKERKLSPERLRCIVRFDGARDVCDLVADLDLLELWNSLKRCDSAELDTDALIFAFEPLGKFIVGLRRSSREPALVEL